MILTQEERKLVEAFRSAESIRIIINENAEDRLNIFFPVRTQATKGLRYNLRWAIQNYLGDVKREAASRTENNQDNQ